MSTQGCSLITRLGSGRLRLGTPGRRPKEKADATAFKKDVINWNKKHGGLVGSPEEEAETKKDPKKKNEKEKKPKGIMEKLGLWMLTT